MAKQDDIPNGCIPEQIDCLVTRGIVSDRLGIVDGTGLNSAIEKIVKDLDDQARTGTDTTTVTDTTTEVTTTETIESFTKKTRLGVPADISSKAIGGNVQLSYNFGSAISELGCDATQTLVEVISANGNRVYSGSTPTGSTSLTAESYPITLSVEITCLKNGKETRVSYKKQIRETTAAYKEYVNACSTESTNISSQADRNSFYDGNISDLRYRVESIENYKFDGAADLNDTLACTRLELNNLAARQNEIDTTCEGRTLCEAFTALDALETKMDVIVQELERLQVLVNNATKIA